MPEQAEACKTHEEVLSFLQKIKDNPETVSSLNFYHMHNTSYDGHRGTWPKGQAHQCELDKQISFVRYKISEQEHGVWHEPAQLKWCDLQ